MHIPVSWCQESTHQELQRLFLCVYGRALLNFHVLITLFFALIYKDPPQHRTWTSCNQHRLSLSGLGLKLFRYHRLSLRDAGFRHQTVNPPSPRVLPQCPGFKAFGRQLFVQDFCFRSLPAPQLPNVIRKSSSTKQTVIPVDNHS